MSDCPCVNGQGCACVGRAVREGGKDMSRGKVQGRSERLLYMCVYTCKGVARR